MVQLFPFGKKDHSHDIWSARLCQKRRLKVARKGWLHRLRSRIRGQYGVGPRMSPLSCSTNCFGPLHHTTFASFVDKEQPAAFHDLTHLPPNLFLNTCRGGGGGSAATARKRWEKDRDQALLQGLAGLLAQFKTPEEKGKNKGTGKGKGKPLAQGSKGDPASSGQSSKVRTVDEVGLLGALARLVERANKRPEGLLDRLVALVDVASTGKSLESEKRKKKKNRPRNEPLNDGAKQKGNKGGKSGPQTSQGKGNGPAHAPSSTWAHIVGGKKVSGDAHGPKFNLRPVDWDAYTVVPQVQQFGNWVDKAGKTKPFIFLVHDQEQLDEAAALVAGDTDIKASVIQVLGFETPFEIPQGSNLVKRETKVPLVDFAGKVSTRKVLCWSNHDTFEKSMVRVVVPVEKRPPIVTRETSKLDTIVIRLSIDKRFTESKVWNKVCQNPGIVARAWMKEAAPACGPLLMDTWGWELLSGADGPDSVVKGLVRVKQKDQLADLLAASGKLAQNVRIFLDPLDWNLTPKPWGKRPYVSWVEKRAKEDDQAYMARAAKLNVNCGLAKGWRQIGVRSMTSNSPAESVPLRTWILKAAPRFWALDQVTNFLDASQFESIEFVSKKWDKFGTSWIFKGKRDGPAYLQLLYSGDQFDTEAGKFLVVERVQPAAWKQSNRIKLREEKSVSLRTGQSSAQTFPHLAPSGTSEPGTPTGQKESAMEDTDTGKRGQSDGVRESPAKKRARSQPLPAGVTKVTIPGGGDCLFYSVSQSLQFADDKHYNHRQVRAAAVAHLRRHASKYSHFWDFRQPDGSLVQMQDLQADFLKY